MTSPYDMIEQLAAMQIVAMTPAVYRASQETIKAAIQTIGEQVDEVERLRSKLAEVDKSLGEYSFQLPAGNGAFYLDHGVHVAIGQLRRAEAEVERLQAERRWIPVGERLPEAHIEVLLITRYGGRFVGYLGDDGRWESEGATILGVTHWQPLPEGPEAAE